jgi:hypothetical protein
MAALILQTSAAFHFLPLTVLIVGMGRNWMGNMIKAFQWEGFFVLGLKRYYRTNTAVIIAKL